MQKNVIVVIFILCISSALLPMSTLFIKPSTTFPKPRFATQTLTTLEIQLAHTWASNSFNAQGQKVPLLAFHGPEDLLNRQIDPNLPFNDTSSVGKALFSGTLKTNQFGIVFEKNFKNNVFVSTAAYLTNARFSNITLIPVADGCRILTADNINMNTDLKNYLEIFQNKFLSHCNSFDYPFFGPSYLTIGYTRNYQNFIHADFIDISVQAGFLFPEFIFDQNHHGKRDLFFPIYNRINIGVPIQGNIAIGFYDWLNMGATALVIPFISSDNLIPLNPSATHNIILGQQETLSHVQQEPFVYVNCYFEAEQLIPNLSLLLGFSYAKQYKTKYLPCDNKDFPKKIVNCYSLNSPWEILNLTFESEIDFANEDLKSYPRLKLIYIHPIYGKSIYRPDLIAGQFALEILCDF